MNFETSTSHNVHTLWKLQKFTLTEKIFRQIAYLVISLVKVLLSRNFCQKRVRVKFWNFHTVVCVCERAFSYAYSTNCLQEIVIAYRYVNGVPT